MKKLLLLLAFVLSVQTGYSQAGKDTANLLKIGEDMPEFSLVSISGDSVSSDDLYGQIVLLCFYSTISPIANQLVDLINLNIWMKYKDNENFTLLIIDREEKAEVVKAFFEKKNWTMPVYLDQQREVYSKFAVRFFGRCYLFDKESRLMLQSLGSKKDEFALVTKQIDDLLKK
jgi:peroxiredoxin